MDDTPLPDGWGWVLPEDATRLQAELREEMMELHPLFNAGAVCIAHRHDTHDYLYMLSSNSRPQRLAVVHLTWTGESTPDFPWTTFFDGFDDFNMDWRRIDD